MEEDGGAFARDLLARGPRVKGVVAIEKGGPNSAGILHYSTGVDCTDSHGKAHHIVNFAREMGAFTVGVGDGGNEIGFGNIYDTAAQVMPQGSVCQCPCAGGAATVTKTDALLVGAVSNWAAYGLVSMMAYLARRPELVPSAGDVRRMMEGALQGGALDGLYAAPRFCDDGIPLAVHEALATMLGNIVATGLRSYHSVGH